MLREELLSYREAKLALVTCEKVTGRVLIPKRLVVAALLTALKSGGFISERL